MMMPAGMAKLSDRLRKPGTYRWLFGMSARKNAGMPIVSPSVIDSWRGRKGNSSTRTPNRIARPGGVRGLGEEEHRDALDVGDHLTALGDDVGQVRELSVEQDEPRHRLRGGRARVHRDADVGGLDRERVVHAVAGHRDRVPAPLQRHDHALLLLGRHPAEHGEGLEDLAELGIVFGQLARVVALGHVEADLAGDRRDGARVVAGDDPDADPLGAEVRQGVRGIRVAPARGTSARRPARHPRAAARPRRRPSVERDLRSGRVRACGVRSRPVR